VWLNTIEEQFNILTALLKKIPMQGSLSEVVTAAINGSVVSFPTDTVPALAVRPDRAELIYQLKQRNLSQPLILLAANSADLWPFVRGNSAEQEIWHQMASQYWPGAVTLVLPASIRVPAGLNLSGTETIGLRVPNCDVAREILQQTGALATSSANLSGEAPLPNMVRVDRAFPTVTTLAMEHHQPPTSLPSTVIEWTGSGWQILRQGAIMIASLTAEVND
jgi:L-threonylcarbamoyladenylate synthase